MSEGKTHRGSMQKNGVRTGTYICSCARGGACIQPIAYACQQVHAWGFAWVGVRVKGLGVTLRGVHQQSVLRVESCTAGLVGAHPKLRSPFCESA